MHAHLALQPLEPAVLAHDYRDIRRRFFFALVLAVPVVLLSLIGTTHWMDSTVAPVNRNWIDLVLTAPIVLWAAWPFFAHGWKAAVTGRADVFTPIALGIGVAFFFSTAALVFPSEIPEEFRENGNPPLYFETDAVVVVVLLFAQVMELRARASLSVWSRVSETAATNGPLQRIGEWIAGSLVIVTLLAAVAAYAGWSHYGPQPAANLALVSAIAVLIAASPTAFALAAQLPAMAGIGRAVQDEIVIRDARALEKFGAITMLVIDGAMIAKDTNAGQHIRELASHGIDITLATNGSEQSARATAQSLGLAHVASELDADGIVKLIALLKGQAHIVAMAGGDAAALAAADIGVAAAANADAGITLTRGDLGSLSRAYRLARASRANMKENLFFAFAYNAIFIPVAAGAAFFFTGYLLSPMLAATAMALSIGAVIGNALRLRGL